MDSLPDLIKESAEPLPNIDDPEFAAKFDKFASADIILIGDGSHGTSEFYRARAAITQRLIEKHGFRIVAVEADWPDCRQIDRYVCGQSLKGGRHPLDGFTRFPLWMWRNEEVASFIEWLKKHNANVDEEGQAHFYGLDLYSMGSSIRAVIDYLDTADPETAKVARERYGCLRPWVEDPSRYGRASLTAGYALCEKKVVGMLVDLLRKRGDLARDDGDSFFDAEMNARVVAGAEQYYREMYYGRDQSWNLRDTHMFESLDRLIEVTGGAKAIVWAHNSHVGDARATSMGQARGELNIGQLCRENYGEDAVCIIGCSTHTGTVAAADNWDGPMRVMQVRPSLRESYERVMYASGLPSFLLDLRQNSDENRQELRKELMRPRLERFIGVIYRPDTERWSHYSQAILPKQMDAFVWFQETSAVHPFEIKQPAGEAPAVEETFPFGL